MRSVLFSALVTSLMAAMVLTGASVRAGELDRQKTVSADKLQLAAQLPKTLVMRVNNKTKQVEYLHSQSSLITSDTVKAKVAQAQFSKAQMRGKPAGELDRQSSQSSWYFCFPTYNWYQPAYYYSGYSYAYTPYYNYYYGDYTYYYYRWAYY